MSREARREKLWGFMDRHGLKAFLLRRPANFAWYTNGADNRVDHADPLGVATILVTTEAEYVVTDNIEAPRMREEETQNFEVIEHPWYQSPMKVVEEAVGGFPLGADYPLEEASDYSREVAPLRYVLDEDATDRYRRLGADAATAVGEAVASLAPEMDEREAAANLAASCRRRGIVTPVLIAAGEERVSRYRHPILRGSLLGNRVMLVVCAERGGLYANLTRLLCFEGSGAELERRQQTCEAMLRRMREVTVPGRTLAEVFKDCKRFYAEEGFPDEWKNHHQGGLTGYGSREVVATSETALELESGMAFAWNPSVTGAKAEETCIITASGPEILTGS